MEVHAHAHTPRKKWTHYFWEFLMLFLAVFCGFMAENIREHKIEHKRARQFAISLVNDLKADTAALHTAITYGNIKVKTIDSLTAQLDQPMEKWNATVIYKYEGVAGRVRPFNHNSGTYEQMKASGSLRYFNQKLSDLLNQYDVQSKKTKIREDILVNYASDLLNPLIFQIMEARSVIQMQNGLAPTHPLVFRIKDKDVIYLWINYATAVQSTQERTVVEYIGMLEKAEEVIDELKKEYHIK